MVQNPRNLWHFKKDDYQIDKVKLMDHINRGLGEAEAIPAKTKVTAQGSVLVSKTIH
jgi:hypothetical protein